MAFAMALNREDDCKEIYARIQFLASVLHALSPLWLVVAPHLEALRYPITLPSSCAKHSRLGPSPPRALRAYRRHKGEVH